MDVELALQVLPPDVRQPREPRRQARRVEQAVQPSELDDGAPHQVRQTRVVPDVHRDCDGAIGVRPRDLPGDGIRGGLVEVGDYNVRPFRRKPSRGRVPDAAAAPDHDGDLAGNQPGGALSRVLLVDFAALERPVLERVHLRLGNELECGECFRIRNRLEHCAIAQIGRNRAALVAGRRDHAEPRGEHDLGPIIERVLLEGGVAPVIRLVLRALL